MEAVYNIFAYLKKHENSKIVFDPRRPAYDDSWFVEAKWKDLYGDVTEDIPTNKPDPRGTPVKVSLFSDADHAGNLLTRRSHTGLMIFLNNALIDWYSKGQATVESSTFGSETIALCTACEGQVELKTLVIPTETNNNAANTNPKQPKQPNQPDQLEAVEPPKQIEVLEVA